MTSGERIGTRLSGMDRTYIETHRRAAMKALGYAAEMFEAADRYFGDDEWELGAQAEEDARGFEQQAHDEFARADARLRRAELDQSVLVEASD